MQVFNYSENQKWFERATRVIPCGVYGHFSPAPCVPTNAYPFFSTRADGCKFWDVDGNEFIDYMCAYGPMIMGYHNPVVDEAFINQLKQADANSIASTKMVELAEFLVDLIPVADWAFFAKNGADVTNYAVMIARAETGRKKIIAIKGGYHGTAPWMQGIGHPGVTEEDVANVIRIPWNDLKALEQALEENYGQVAGFISSPYHHPVFIDNEYPAEGYWDGVQKLLKKHGVVLICDDVRAGFRLHLGGSNEYFKFKPDLICFCKAIANGYPISALVGKEELKVTASKVFHTGSYWYSAAFMSAAIANLQELKRLNAPEYLEKLGNKFNEGLIKLAQNYGFHLKVTGHPAMAYYRITDDPSLQLHQKWCAECTKRGAFFTSHHNWFLSMAHTDADIQKTWNICEEAFKTLKSSI